MLLHGSRGDDDGEVAADLLGLRLGLVRARAAAGLLAPAAAAGLRAPAASPAASFLGFCAAGGSMAAGARLPSEPAVILTRAVQPDTHTARCCSINVSQAKSRTSAGPPIAALRQSASRAAC